MLAFTSLALASLALAARAAPLAPRTTTNTTICRPEVSGDATQISYADSTRDGWKAEGLTDGTFTGISVTVRGTMSTAGPQFAIKKGDTDRGTYTIEEIDLPGVCAVATEGSIAGGDCNSEQAQWFITCESCRETGGSECQFQSAYQGQCFEGTEYNEPSVLKDCVSRQPTQFSNQYFTF